MSKDDTKVLSNIICIGIVLYALSIFSNLQPDKDLIHLQKEKLRLEIATLKKDYMDRLKNQTTPNRNGLDRN